MNGPRLIDQELTRLPPREKRADELTEDQVARVLAEAFGTFFTSRSRYIVRKVEVRVDRGMVAVYTALQGHPNVVLLVNKRHIRTLRDQLSKVLGE